MCGIAGVAGSSTDLPETAIVSRMVASLARRGPDGTGVHRFGSAILGHSRLAIFDLSSAGRQPMLQEDRRVGVVLNGAIYNFVELRAELERAGATFRTRTDTEVLLWGYVAWGLDGLVQRLQGMFAFALWDDAQETLWLVRDRLGVKPLLYAQRGPLLAFASTITALRTGGWLGELDAGAVANFLEYGYVPEGQAIFRGACKVPAATIVEFAGGQLTQRCYWTPPTAHTVTVPFGEAVEESERLLLRATERRLQADVAVGAMLSGGIDSALVCWSAKALGSDLPVYTVTTPDDADSEATDATATATALGLRHHLVPVRDADFGDVATIVAAYGEPFACSSALGMLMASRAVSDAGVRVLLTGDGGDDVFLGYERHLAFARAQRLAAHLPLAAGPAWRALRDGVPDRGALRRAKLRIDVVTGGLGAFLSAPDGLPAFRRRGLLGPRLRDETTNARQLPWSVAAARRVLTEYLEHDRRTQFVAEYLTKVDGASMHYALEARSPFLDQSLWEFASSLPVAVRLHDGKLKAILREIAARRVSRRVAAGAKRGFRIPVRQWITGRWRDRALEILVESQLVRGGWISPRRLAEEFTLACRYRPAATRLWYLLVLELWMRDRCPC